MAKKKVGKKKRAPAKQSAFKKLQGQVAAGYEAKGMSAAEAEKIGGAVAYKQGVKKLGKKKMVAKAKAGRKQAAKKGVKK